MEKAPKGTSSLAPSDNQPSGRPRAADGAEFGALLDCLNCERRQAVIDILNLKGAQTVRELARPIAADENDIPVQQVGSAEYRRVRIALHQSHLRKLDTAGVVEWDGSGDVVTPGPAFESARDMLHGARDGYAEAEAGVEVDQ